jgi:hypothetical protein
VFTWMEELGGTVRKAVRLGSRQYLPQQSRQADHTTHIAFQQMSLHDP